VCLPFNDNLVSINTNSIQYVKKNQWDEYSLLLTKIANQLLK
jgi:hypothetical protein